MEKEGLGEFTLDVIVIPSHFSELSYCFLEQYYLLNKNFNLNTHKIVNFRVNQGFKIFLYDKNSTILYHTSSSLNAFCADLGIHNSSYKKYVNKNEPYLGSFIISSTFITDTTPANLTLSELRALLNEHREKSLINRATLYGKAVEVFDKVNNKKTIYYSITNLSKELNIAKSTIRKYLDNGQL